MGPTDLAGRGFRVFPLHGIDPDKRACTCGQVDCHAPGKHPRVKGWREAATTDPAVVRQWWEQWPDANVGISTDGLVVLDVDPRNGGEESFLWLEGNEEVPQTLTVRTGGGGRHLIYRAPRDEDVRSGQLLPGIDVKAGGGLIVGPGSRHQTGGTYEILDDTDLAPAPPWLRPRKRERAKSEWDEGPIPEGQRNDFLVHVAARLRNASLPEEAIRAALWQVNLERCSPPESEERVADIASWAAQQDVHDPWTPRGEGEQALGDAQLAYAFSLREVRAGRRERSWLIRELLLHPTYGLVGGEQKALKSWVSLELAVALASGTPAFGDDRFQVDQAKPVLLLYGEGGLESLDDRLAHLAKSRGLDGDGYLDLPMRAVFETPPVGSSRLRDTLIDALDRFEPALVVMDPLYRYLPEDADLRSLVSTGRYLNQLQQEVYGRGASLLVPHHFNRSERTGLARVSGAGGAEWADSWLLLDHRQDPDLVDGRFFLELDVGSRQWDGGRWDVDVALGKLNRETFEWEGKPDWQVRWHRDEDSDEPDDVAVWRGIQAYLRSHPDATEADIIADLAEGWGARRVRKILREGLDNG